MRWNRRSRKLPWLDDYLESMNQMKNMGGISSVLNMLPGLGNKAKDIEGMIDEKDMARKEASSFP